MLQSAISELMAAVHDAPGLDERTLFAAIDTMQEYGDYLESLEENLPVSKTEPFFIHRTPEQLAEIEAWAQSLAERKSA